MNCKMFMHIDWVTESTLQLGFPLVNDRRRFEGLRGRVWRRRGARAARQLVQQQDVGPAPGVHLGEQVPADMTQRCQLHVKLHSRATVGKAKA